MKRWISLPPLVLGLAVMAIFGIARVQFDALQEPGAFETAIATRAKHLLVQWSSRDSLPAAPANLRASVEEGNKLFGAECAACHGLDGHKATDAGRWMSPRAADLTSHDVQQYSDRELFWIVKHGVRFSGMPAFGAVESDEHIWNLIHYLRTLPGPWDTGNSQVSHNPKKAA
jgi:mono/diheme cytochrome c family protein